MKKICTKCKIEKFLEDFFNKKTGKFGKTGMCKICIIEKNKEWAKKNPEKKKEIANRYSAKNREKIKEYSRKYLKENYEKEMERKRRYKKNNKEIISKKNKIYRDNHKEENIKYRRYYNKNNLEKKANLESIRRARKLNQTPFWVKPHHTQFFFKLRDILTDIFGEKFHVDHRISLYDGGEHSPFNLHVITARENLEKNRNSYII